MKVIEGETLTTAIPSVRRCYLCQRSNSVIPDDEPQPVRYQRTRYEDDGVLYRRVWWVDVCGRCVPLLHSETVRMARVRMRGGTSL
jgi:hypothetical protein